MAAVGQRLGWGAYGFARKTCNCYLIKSRKTQGKSAVKVSSLSAGFLFSDIKNDQLCAARNTSDRVTAGVSLDGYKTVTPISVTEPYSSLRPTKKYKLVNNSWGDNVEKTRSAAKFRGTLRSAGPPQSPASLRLCRGYGQFVCIRAYSGDGTRSEPLYNTKTGYYDILEVTQTATQVQIKTAYYKQSFIYHPDRNAGSDAATLRFSEISEAYTVLGNKFLRKKYDRGLLSQSDLLATARPSAKDPPGGSAKRHTDSRRSVMGTDLHGDVGDFDKFFKAVYSEQLQREKDIRARREEVERRKREELEEMDLSTVTLVGLGAMLALAVALVVSLKSS